MEKQTLLAIAAVLFFMFLIYAAVDAENMSFDLQRTSVPEVTVFGHPLHVYNTVAKRHYAVAGRMNGTPISLKAVHFENSQAARKLEAQVRKNITMTIVSSGSAYILTSIPHVDVENNPENNPEHDVILYAFEADDKEVFPWVCDCNMGIALNSTNKVCGIHRSNV